VALRRGDLAAVDQKQAVEDRLQQAQVLQSAVGVVVRDGEEIKPLARGRLHQPEGRARNELAGLRRAAAVGVAGVRVQIAHEPRRSGAQRGRGRRLRGGGERHLHLILPALGRDLIGVQKHLPRAGLDRTGQERSRGIGGGDGELGLPHAAIAERAVETERGHDAFGRLGELHVEPARAGGHFKAEQAVAGGISGGKGAVEHKRLRGGDREGG